MRPLEKGDASMFTSPAIDCLKSRGPAGTDLVAAFKHFYLYAAALKWEAHFAWLEWLETNTNG